MESATKTKSSPELTEFMPSVPVPAAKPVGFSVHASFWATLESDPVLKAEMERHLAQRVSERVESATQEYRATVIEEAKTEGRKQGYEEGRAALRKSVERVEEVCVQILEEKAEIMRSHQREWCLAMAHLMRRFLVPRPKEMLAALEAWIEESLGTYVDRERVRVFVAPEDFAAMSAGETSGPHWDLVSDPALERGQIRAECDGAGVFFSAKEQWQRLDDLVERVCGLPSEAAP